MKALLILLISFLFSVNCDAPSYCKLVWKDEVNGKSIYQKKLGYDICGDGLGINK